MNLYLLCKLLTGNEEKMPNYRIIAASVVIFVAAFYFFMLPLLISAFEVFQEKLISYYLNMLYKIKVVGTVLIGMTILYMLQTGIKHIDWELVKRKAYKTFRRLAPSSSVTKEESGEGDEKDQTSSTSYPLQKVFLIASEMLSTEEKYVKELKIIEETFHVRVEKENLLPPDVIRQIFSNIRAIYQFHNEFLLPSLRERMTAWKEQKEKVFHKKEANGPSSVQRIGDIFVKQAKFLTMYTSYIRDFDNAMNTIDKQRKRNKKFAAVMDEIQASPDLERLSLQHHMLAPVQRIPRYKLLLEDYIKKLPENSSDLEDAKKALELVEEAASHSNESMKRIEQVKKILEVQQNIGNTIMLLHRSRDFVKEGKVSKISVTNRDTLKEADRYLFLFNDILLLCSPSSLTKRWSGGPKYKLKERFDFDSLVVTDNPEDQANEKSFSISHVNSPDKMKVELLARTIEEKEEWVQTLSKALQSFNQRKSVSLIKGLQDLDSYSIDETEENENNSDDKNCNTHDDDILEEEEGDEVDSRRATLPRLSKSSLPLNKSRHSIATLERPIKRSTSPIKRMVKKNSIMF